ncbi:hypothetical protein [Streptomyces sp. NRRL S-1022]|uniref:hypothetical protein n=1 Tax=Streptomyces sp. NRRL S-1022 TaxID=1463880 RepID=UPI0004BF946C|nr:hypothetical protein [Streptomyces sp. NRRL S-1022]
MAGQISVEDAFPTFQKKVRELFEANLLLQAQVDVLERRVTELTEENTRLQQASPGRPESGPGAGLAVPPRPEPDERS